MTGASCTVGLDIGTTNVKAIAFDAYGSEVAHEDRGIPLIHEKHGEAEQDPHAVYEVATQVLAQVAFTATQLGYTVSRVGLSAAMHSLIAVAADGKPLTNALLWMDTRASKEAAMLWQTSEGKAIYKRTGTPVHAMSPLCKLLWLRQYRSDVFADARRFVSLKEWLWNRWFQEWCVDASIASATGLYSLREGSWDRKALATAGIRPDQLSTIVPTTYTQNSVREQRLHKAGLTKPTAFTIGASDGVLAHLGIGALDPDQMVLNIGTSLAVRTGSPRPVTDPSMQLFSYILDRNHYIVGAPSNNGGILLEWFYRRCLGQDGSGAENGLTHMIAEAQYVQTGSLICLPYIAGERAPLWSTDARAAFFGLELEHTGTHLMRAVLEGMILNASWIASRLFDKLGRPDQILATGRIMETEWIRQLTADVFDLPVGHPGTVDASVRGAAMLANMATGLEAWKQELTSGVEDVKLRYTLTKPSGTHEIYDEKLRRFKRLAEVTLADFGRM